MNAKGRGVTEVADRYAWPHAEGKMTLRMTQGCRRHVKTEGEDRDCMLERGHVRQHQQEGEAQCAESVRW